MVHTCPMLMSSHRSQGPLFFNKRVVDENDIVEKTTRQKLDTKKSPVSPSEGRPICNHISSRIKRD